MMDRQTHPHELISAMLDGEIDAQERAAVEAHLRECRECRDLWGDLAALGEALGDEPVPPVPAGLASRIGWSLRSVGASRRRIVGMRWSGPRMLTALGGVAAAAVLAVLVVREGAVPNPWLPQDRPALEPRASAPAPSVGTGPAREDTAAGANMNKAADKDEADADAEEKLRSLGYVGSGGSSSAPRSRDGRSAAPGDVSLQSSGGGGSPSGTGTSGAKRDVFAYAPPPPLPSRPAQPSATRAPAHGIPPTPVASDRRGQGELQKLEAGVGVAPSSAGAPAAESIPREEAGTTPRSNAPAAAREKEQVEGYAETGEMRQLPPAAPPPPTDARAARAEPGALSASKSKVLDNEVAAKVQASIPACAADHAKDPGLWTATTAPLPLRAARSDAEPDLAGLAARLGGTLCADSSAGTTTPLLVLEAPVARWIDLRDALIARAAAEPSLSAPPAQGYDRVRVVVRSK